MEFRFDRKTQNVSRYQLKASVVAKVRPDITAADIKDLMSQQDLICTRCPLADCDEESLFCCFRWATNPNQAQLNVATFRLIPQRLTSAERSRKWRQQNPERWAEIQRNRRAKQKEENPIGYAIHLAERRKKAKEKKCTI